MAKKQGTKTRKPVIERSSLLEVETLPFVVSAPLTSSPTSFFALFDDDKEKPLSFASSLWQGPLFFDMDATTALISEGEGIRHQPLVVMRDGEENRWLVKWLETPIGSPIDEWRAFSVALFLGWEKHVPEVRILDPTSLSDIFAEGGMPFDLSNWREVVRRYRLSRYGWKIAERGEMQISPTPVAIRWIEGELYSLGEVLEALIGMGRARRDFFLRFFPTMEQLCAFDALIFNRDRHGGNLLIVVDENAPGIEVFSSIFWIDHQLSFSSSPPLHVIDSTFIQAPEKMQGEVERRVEGFGNLLSLGLLGAPHSMVSRKVSAALAASRSSPSLELAELLGLRSFREEVENMGTLPYFLSRYANEVLAPLSKFSDPLACSRLATRLFPQDPPKACFYASYLEGCGRVAERALPIVSKIIDRSRIGH